MNQQQLSNLITIVVALLLAPTSYFVAKGFLTADQASALQPAMVTVVTIGGGALLTWWGHRRNSANGLTLAVNSDSVPGVKVVKLDAPAEQVIVSPRGLVVPDPSVNATPAPKAAK